MLQSPSTHPPTHPSIMNLVAHLSFLLLLPLQSTAAINNKITVVPVPIPIPIPAAFAAPRKGSKNKSRKSKNKNAVGGAGFGHSTQPSLDELNFPTRIPSNALEQPCPCGGIASNKNTNTNTNGVVLYKDCCHPFHTKEKVPRSALDVLRTRYTAFSWRMIPYVIETTHAVCRDFKKDQVKWARDLNRNGMFDSYDFVGLEIVDEVMPMSISINDDHGDDQDDDHEKEAFIDFKVLLRANVNSGEHIQGQEIVVQEKSRFLLTRSSTHSSSTSDVHGHGHGHGHGHEQGGGWKYAGGDVTSNIAGLEDTKLNY